MASHRLSRAQHERSTRLQRSHGESAARVRSPKLAWMGRGPARGGRGWAHRLHRSAPRRRIGSSWEFNVHAIVVPSARTMGRKRHFAIDLSWSCLGLALDHEPTRCCNDPDPCFHRLGLRVRHPVPWEDS
eukprot:scaffold810_cov355-Pavlova_lutheri.AAC.26